MNADAFRRLALVTAGLTYVAAYVVALALVAEYVSVWAAVAIPIFGTVLVVAMTFEEAAEPPLREDEDEA